MRHAYEIFENAINHARNDAEEAHAEEMRHREADLMDALKECKSKGVSEYALKILVFETGARWKPQGDQ